MTIAVMYGVLVACNIHAKAFPVTACIMCRQRNSLGT